MRNGDSARFREKAGWPREGEQWKLAHKSRNARGGLQTLTEQRRGEMRRSFREKITCGRYRRTSQQLKFRRVHICRMSMDITR